MSRQGAEEFTEKLARLAAHPFAGEVFLTGEGEHEGRARTGTADAKSAGGFVEADRPFAAQDPQQSLAVHAHLAGDLVPRLVGVLDSVCQGSRDTVVRVSGDRWGWVHGRPLPMV